MRAAGCYRVEMGIECASPEGLKVLRKGIKREQILDAFRWAKDARLETLAFAMVNVPGETLDDIDETLHLLQSVDPDFIQLSYCTPYPGTPLYDQAQAGGRLRTTDYREYRFLRRPVLDNGVLTEGEVLAAHQSLLRRFYLRPGPILRLARRTLTDRGARLSTLRTVLSNIPHLLRSS
jgi:radical SAM superfamily enzyme YgiQ (UPF0313 family)